MLIAGCSVIVKKRRYLKGFYVHFPQKNGSLPEKNPRRFFPPPLPVIRRMPDSTQNNFSVRRDSLTGQDTLAAVNCDSSLCVMLIVPSAATKSPSAASGIPSPVTGGPAPSGIVSTGQPSSTGGSTRLVPVADTLRRDTTPQFVTITGTPVRPDTVSWRPTADSIPDTLLAVVLPPADSLVPPADSPAVTPDSVAAPLPGKTRKSREFRSVLYASLGNNGGQYQGAIPAQLHSFAFGAGLRAATPLGKRIDIYGDLGIFANNYFLDTDKPKTAPLTESPHDRERIAVNRLTLGTGLHYAFREKEGKPEQSIDFCLSGDWNYRTKNIFVDNFSDPDSPTGRHFHSRTKITGLPYLRPLTYGVTVRYNRSCWSVFAGYRISDLLRRSHVPSGNDLPKLTIGLELFAG